MPTLLILAASPDDQSRLALNREVKRIKHALERSKNREHWKIETNEAVTVQDLRRALLDHKPTVVHFSGHGTGLGGLCFETEQGGTHLTQAAPFAKLLHHFKDKLKCVVLNACYSEVQGEAIRQEVDYVIGMKSAIDDESATSFAVAFYDAVFAEAAFRTAFDIACTAIDLDNLPDVDAPVFLTAPHLSLPSLTYTADIPEIERVLFAYFNAPFQERWKYTTAGEALKDRMKEYYGEAMPVRCDKVTVVRQMPVGGRHHKVEARVRGSGDVQGTGIWFVRIEDRSVLIDWPASVGLWSMPVKTCLALGSDQAVLARVTAVLDDYYNYTFSGKEDIVQSVRLEAQNNTVHGYVKRHSPVCDQLIGILKDGNEHQITVLFRQVGNQLDHVLIVALVSRTWILEPPDEVTARRELSG